MPIRPWAVGLFIVIGLGLLTALLFIIGGRQDAFGKHVEFETEFSNLSGLAPGTKVRVSGMDAGKITSVAIPNSASEKFRLTLDVQEKVHSMIHNDSVVSIETDGVVGDKFLLIKRGSDRTGVAQPGSTLPSKEPFDISAVMDQASNLLKDVHQTVGDIQGRVDVALDSITGTVNHADGLITNVSPQIRKITRDGSRITGQVNTLISDLNAGKGSAGLLLRDDEAKRQLQDTLANAEKTSANVNDASARADQVINDFQSRQLVAKAQATLENVQAVSARLNTAIKDALAQDNMGADGAENLRQTLSNINRSTANLADDTEALKHNFFFRGFFKKRGFFSLDTISPAEYRIACDRHKDFGKRLWLPASIFEVGADGKESLSEAGRRQVDLSVAPVIAALAGHLIVAEGYALNGDPGFQFAAAWRRADQVRRYLQAHYHLEHTNVGVVALADKPPESAGLPSWDGAAIMLLDAKVDR